MVFHMKTTLNISDVIMRAVKGEAALRGQTISKVVESALRGVVEPPRQEINLPPLPEFSSGGTQVNVANREALYEIMGR